MCKEKIMGDTNQTATSELSLEKKAELEKEAEERISAFEYGSDLFFKDHGIDKQALSEISGIPMDKITEACFICLDQAMKADAAADEANASPNS